MLLGPGLKLEMNLLLSKELIKPGVLLRVKLEIEKPSAKGDTAEEEKITDLGILSRTENNGFIRCREEPIFGRTSVIDVGFEFKTLMPEKKDNEDEGS